MVNGHDTYGEFDIPHASLSAFLYGLSYLDSATAAGTVWAHRHLRAGAREESTVCREVGAKRVDTED